MTLKTKIKVISCCKVVKLSTVIAVSGLVLTACTTLPSSSQSAAQAFNAAMIKSLDKDASYNFTAEQSVKLIARSIAVVDVQKQPQAGAQIKTYADCDTEYDKKRNEVQPLADTSSIEDDYYSCLDEVDGQQSVADDELDDIRKLMTPRRIDAINKYLLKPLHSRVSGAYDAGAKQMQLTYEIEYSPDNFTLAARLPMLFDLNDISITLDPSLFLPILGPVLSEEVGTDWEGKGVKFYLPKEYVDRVPVDLLARALSKAVLKAYGSIDEEQFSYVSKDSFAKSTGATKVVQLKMTPKVQLNLADKLITEWVNQVEIEANLHPEQINNPKEFNTFLQMAKEFTKDGFLGKMGLAGEEMSEEDLALFLSPKDYNIHLDKAGRMVGFSAMQNLEIFAKLINADVHSLSKGTVSNYGHPKFSFRPMQSDIIDGNQFVIDMMEKYPSGIDGVLGADDSDEADTTDTAWDAYDETFEACMSTDSYGENLDDDAYYALEDKCYKEADAAYDELKSEAENAVSDTDEVTVEAGKDVAAATAAEVAVEAVADVVEETEMASDDLSGNLIESDHADSALQEFCEKEGKNKGFKMCQ